MENLPFLYLATLFILFFSDVIQVNSKMKTLRKNPRCTRIILLPLKIIISLHAYQPNITLRFDILKAQR